VEAVTGKPEEVRMSVDRVVVQRPLMADVHVRVNQSGNKKASAPIDALCMRAGNKTSANLSNPSVANDYVGMRQGSGSFGRDHRYIFEHNPVIHHPGARTFPCLRTGKNSQKQQ
jgi:hypothetical protein